MGFNPLFIWKGAIYRQRIAYLSGTRGFPWLRRAAIFLFFAFPINVMYRFSDFSAWTWLGNDRER